MIIENFPIILQSITHFNESKKSKSHRKRLKKSKDSFHQTFKKKEKKEGKEDRCRKEQVNSSNKEIRPPLLFRHHKEVSTTAKMMQK